MLQDSAGEPLYKLFKAIKHQVEKGPVDAVQKKAKYTLNDTGLLGDDVEYAPLVSPGPGWGWASDGVPHVAGLWAASVPGARGHSGTQAQLSPERGCESPAAVGAQGCLERDCVSWRLGLLQAHLRVC